MDRSYLGGWDCSTYLSVWFTAWGHAGGFLLPKRLCIPSCHVQCTNEVSHSLWLERWNYEVVYGSDVAASWRRLLFQLKQERVELKEGLLARNFVPGCWLTASVQDHLHCNAYLLFLEQEPLWEEAFINVVRKSITRLGLGLHPRNTLLRMQ